MSDNLIERISRFLTDVSPGDTLYRSAAWEYLVDARAALEARDKEIMRLHKQIAKDKIKLSEISTRLHCLAKAGPLADQKNLWTELDKASVHLSELSLDWPLKSPSLRRAAVKNNQCPECAGELDTGGECNQCSYDTRAALANKEPSDAKYVPRHLLPVRRNSTAERDQLLAVNAESNAAIDRADKLINWMASYIGNMAPGSYRNCYADLNSHGIFMQNRAAALAKVKKLS